MATPTVIIKHGRFIIRRYTTKDAAGLVKYFGHPAVLKGARGITWVYKNNDAKKFLLEKLRQYRRRKPVVKNNEIDTLGYAIEINGQLVGGVGVTLDDQAAEIGFWLAKPFWGRGIMTAVVKAWTHYVFRTFKLNQVEAKVFPLNQASIKVLQKNGFHFESWQVKSHKAGKIYLDQMIFAKTK